MRMTDMLRKSLGVLLYCTVLLYILYIWVYTDTIVYLPNVINAHVNQAVTVFQSV